MNIEEQVKIMEAQINSDVAQFSFIEKLQYLHDYFKPDPMFLQESIDIVIGNLSKTLKDKVD